MTRGLLFVSFGTSHEATRVKTIDVVAEEVRAAFSGRALYPVPGFLEGLRELRDREGALLVFDEVICGFRLAYGGAAERFGITPDLVTYGKIIGGGIEDLVEQAGVPLSVNHIGSLGSLFFTPGPVVDYASAKQSDTQAFARYFRFMLERGIYLAPSQFEAMFVSCSHDDAALEETLATVHDFLARHAQPGIEVRSASFPRRRDCV